MIEHFINVIMERKIVWKSLNIKWGWDDDTSIYFFSCFFKLDTEFFVTDFFGGSRHIFEQFVKSSPSPDDRSFVWISFLADIFKVVTIAPIKSDLDKLFFDTFYVVVLKIKRKVLRWLAFCILGISRKCFWPGWSSLRVFDEDEVTWFSYVLYLIFIHEPRKIAEMQFRLETCRWRSLWKRGRSIKSRG